MKKVTMQEFADMLGVYVAKNENKSVCCFIEKPIKKQNVYDGSCYWWQEDKNHIFPIEITPFISDAEMHEWKILVEPK